MNKDENALTAEQLAYLFAANQQLLAAAAAAAASNVPPPQLPKTNVMVPPSQSQVPTAAPVHLQNQMAMTWLAGLSAFQSLQKHQSFQDQYTNAVPAYPSTANAAFGHSSSPVQAEPTYVNAKQYHRILKRRQARQVLETYFARTRRERDEKPYLHYSRHRHAVNRPRGKGGRFLTKSEIEKMKRESTPFDEEEMPSFKKRQCDNSV